MSSPVIVHVICEGQTELHFVIQVLAPYMQDRGLLLLPSLIGDTGGHVTFARLLQDVKACIHQQGHYVTTLLDYYGLAGDWDGLDAPATAAATEKALRLEEATSARMAGELPSGVAYRFIPYFAMHEFEGMLFSDPAVLAEVLAVETQAVQAVADAKRGGIRTIMITGDHKVTASAIARQLGIFRDGDEAVSGVELDGMTDTELDERLPHISVYARVSPEHKIRIVNAWQRRGNIVSMTGDGVNDAPALKKADIGVAMGITGTEVSKDAASMILADDNFATIVKAVVNGRSVYANIKNAIQFLLSGNTAGIFCVLYASLLALPVPFQPVHLLFINLLTDSLPAIAIGMEPARKGLLDQKPRDPREPILNRPLLARIGGQGLLIAIVTMIAFYLGYQGGDAVMASTMAFATLTLARLFHGFNCRGSESIFRLKLSTNKYSVLAFLAGVVLLLLVLFTPGLKSLFMVAPAFGFANLGEIVLLAFLPTLVIQLVKLVCDARRGK